MDRRRIGFVEVISSVTDVLNSILSNFVIGDQVPDYPIKSKATLESIVKAIKTYLPEPRSVIEAQSLLIRAQNASAEAYAKGGAVNVTYGMIYDETAQALKNYIAASGGSLPMSTNLPTATKPPDDFSKPAAGTKTLLIVGVVGIALLMLLKKR